MPKDFQETTDPALVRKAIDGSQDAIAQLWQRVQARLTELVARNIDDKDEAADLVADLRLRIFERLHTLREPAAFDAWLLRLARNAMVDTYRSRASERHLIGAPEFAEERDGPTQVEGRLMEAERRRRHAQIVRLVWEEVAKLSPRDREIIELIIREDVTAAAAAQQLGISLSAAKMRFYRAIRRLNRRVSLRLKDMPDLAEYYWTAPSSAEVRR